MSVEYLEKLEKKVIESLEVIDRLREENKIIKISATKNEQGISNDKILKIKSRLREIVKDISEFRKQEK
ncbi:MAG: hypothetical protein U9N76_03230 [Candidatus Marinimicrobia bacterium]|nr:hypothetical protein [Candidatus Neomarinimicrobiota bacterium]